jgi:hypothetical protein
MLESLLGLTTLTELESSLILPGIFKFGMNSSVIDSLFERIPKMKAGQNTILTLDRYFYALIEIAKHYELASVKLMLSSLRQMRAYQMFIEKSDSEHAEMGVFKSLGRKLEYLLSYCKSGVAENELKKDDMKKHLINFVTTSLKYSFLNSNMVSMVKMILEYAHSFRMELLPPQTMMKMILSHSSSESVLKHNQITKPDAKMEQAKISLVKLIKSLIMFSPSKYCLPEHLLKLIPAYHGTTTQSDRILLSIFYCYERDAGLSTMDWILKEWTTEKEDGDMISKMDMVRMNQTVNYFDINLDIEDMEALQDTAEFPLYDPCFFVPLTSSIISNASTTQYDVITLFQANLFGLAAQTLSSLCLNTRKAGVYLLAKAEEWIKNSSAKERNQLSLVLQTFKDSLVVDEDNEIIRIPSITSAFIAQSFINLMKPESGMYSIINRFLLQRPVIDLKVRHHALTIRMFPSFMKHFFQALIHPVEKECGCFIYCRVGLPITKYFPFFLICRTIILSNVAIF